MNLQGRPLTRQLDLNLLELFDSIFKTKNLTATGAQLGLSQPTVSYGLAKLREAYGDPLFVRMQRGVQPTPFAVGLAEPVAAALQIVRSTIEKATFCAAEARDVFRIAATDVGERYLLPRLSQWLAASAPGISIETSLPSLADLADGLASGEINLAVGYFPGLGKRVCEQVLFREQLIYIMRKNHPGISGNLTLERLRRLPHIVANPPGTPLGPDIERVLLSARVQAPIVMRVRSFLSVGPIVAESELVSPVPGHLASLFSRYLDLRVCPAPIKLPECNISVYWHRRFHSDPAIAWLRETVAKSLSEAERVT